MGFDLELTAAIQEKEVRKVGKKVKVGNAITGWERPHRKSTAKCSASVEVGECAVSFCVYGCQSPTNIGTHNMNSWGLPWS